MAARKMKQERLHYGLQWRKRRRSVHRIMQTNAIR